MSGHRWNNRFNPPLQTATPLFSRRAIETPQTPANHTTHQMPGAPAAILYTNQITQVPPIEIINLLEDPEQLTVVATVSFGYTMTGSDHLEFTFTNSNTGVSTTKSYMPEAKYTIGEFDPGVNYFVYVTPVINGLQTASSATASFLSSPATAPGLIQGLTITGSGSYAILSFTSLYPSRPRANQIAVNDNFGDKQVLVPIEANAITNVYPPFVIGPYTDGSSYQFTITPVTASTGGIYRYGVPSIIPNGNYFIPGPPDTAHITSISADNTTVSFSVNVDTSFHPTPDYYRVTVYTSTLSSTIATVSGPISDLSTSYPAFSISTSALSPQDFLTLSAGVGSCNLVADITDNTGVWYSFRVTDINISGGNAYFTNPYLRKTRLGGSSFSVNFNTVTTTGVISTFSQTSTTFTISDVQTNTYTTFLAESHANKVFGLPEYTTIFAGAPAVPANVRLELGNETFRWTLGMYGYNLPEQPGTPIGPRPISYTFTGNGTTYTTPSFTATISGLINENVYSFEARGYANSVVGQSIGTLVIPSYAPPTSLAVTNISTTTVTLSIGRPLGGTQYGYIITASGQGGVSSHFNDSENPYITAIITGLETVSYEFIAFTQTSGSYSQNNLSAAAPGSYYLGVPFSPTNINGVYLGTVSAGVTVVNLTLTASWGGGPIVSFYSISDNYGSTYTSTPLPNYDLLYNFPDLVSYRSYTFTITPYGNSVSGTPAPGITFNFDPQPPASADLYMTGSNGGIMNISFSGPDFPRSQTDYYSISAVLSRFNPNDPIQNAITRIDTCNSPFQYPASGVQYQFKIFTTICGITSIGFALTPAVTGGPPLQPIVRYTLGCNSVAFDLTVDKRNAVVISNYQIVENYLDVSSGSFLPTGTTYTVTVSPSIRPTTTYTLNGSFTSNYTETATAESWTEASQSTPSFTIFPTQTVDPTNTLVLNTFPNVVILTLSQNPSALTFPVTAFTNQTVGGYSFKYETGLIAKATTVFNAKTALQFTWKSGRGPFTGGSYRYDITSHGNDTLVSPTVSVAVNVYVAAPGNPSVVTSNTTSTVTFSPGPTTSVTPEYYVVSDNYGRTISGTTNLSSFVFTANTTGSDYTYYVLAYAQGISSAPSQLTDTVYPGRPGPPSFQPSFSGLTATLSTVLFLGTTANPYIPIADVCLNIQGRTGYRIQKTNTASSYTDKGTQGPTYILTNLTAGDSYTFSLSAYANQVYSTILSQYSYYFGSLKPNIPNGASIYLNNTTAYISISAAIPGSPVGSVHPDTYVFAAGSPQGQYSTVTFQLTPDKINQGQSPYGRIDTTATGPLTVILYGGGGGGDIAAKYTSAGYESTPGFGGELHYSLNNFPPTTINYSLGEAGVDGKGSPGEAGKDTTLWLGAINASTKLVASGGYPYVDGNYYPNLSGYAAQGGVRVNLPGLSIGNVIDSNYNPDVNLFGNPEYPGWPRVAGRVSIIYSVQPVPSAPITVSVQYSPGSETYIGVISGLTDQTNYQFSGYTVTNNLSYGSQWSDSRIFHAGGPRPFTNPVSYSLPGGTPLTQNVSLQVVIATGCGGVTGLYADTSYFVSLFGIAGVFQMNVSSYTFTVSSGNRYTADVYGIKNNVTGPLEQTSEFTVTPAPPLSPLITLAPTPDRNVVPSVSQIPATLTWGQSETPGVSYYYSVDGGVTYNNNDILTQAQVSLPYGNTVTLRVYSMINGISSAAVASTPAYVFTTPPTNLTYRRSNNIVSLSWGSAFQPANPLTITYTASSTSSPSVNGIYIPSVAPPYAIVGSNLMPQATYTQIVNSVYLGVPMTVRLTGITTTYDQSFQVVSAEQAVIGSAVIGYKFIGNTPGLPVYTGTRLVFSITNPAAFPTNGYIVHNLCSGSVLASNIYSNSYVLTVSLGNTYNLAVQAFNSNIYSVRTSANTGAFRMATVGVSTLSATYNGRNITLSWQTPTQYDGIIPVTNNTARPYTWSIFDQSGNPSGSSSSQANATTQALFGVLGATYKYSIITNYYGISSTTTYANQISLFTSPPTGVTQTTSGAGIIVSWQTASQAVYLPATPLVLSTVPPNAGYYLQDLCGSATYSTTNTSAYIPLSISPYAYHNFTVTAIHNSISSTPASSSSAIFLGVLPPTSPSITLNGMVATLTWSAPLSNGPNVPYEIYDENGSLIGNPADQRLQTVTYSNAGIFSVTALATETVNAQAYGAKGFLAGGYAASSYLVAAGSTIILTVGKTEQYGVGGNSTVYVPPWNGIPYPILDAGGGGYGAGFDPTKYTGYGFNLRNGGIPYPDGGPPGQAGYGSGGATARLSEWGFSPGKVTLTLTAQTPASVIRTTNTSISFTIKNNTDYSFNIVSYSNGLSAQVSVAFDTTVLPPTNLNTTFSGLTLINEWTSPVTAPPQYFITNQLTGDYNIIPSASSSDFSIPGVLNGSYWFTIFSLVNGRPSAVEGQREGKTVTLKCPPPTNFNVDYSNTTITITASGNGYPYNTGPPPISYTLTDGSGNVLLSNIAQSGISPYNITINRNASAGSSYSYALYGLYRGLTSSSTPAIPTTLVIPGSIYEPEMALNGTDITIYPVTPAADTYIVQPVNLASSYYSDAADGVKTWIGVAMSANGRNALAAHNGTDGSNIWFSSNSGQNWTCNYNPARIGYAASHVALAANGTFGAVVTSSGLWMSSNVSALAPWFPVPAVSNVRATAISPSGNVIACIQNVGSIYYANTANLSQFFAANGSNILNKTWGAIAWSGDGSTVLAAVISNATPALPMQVSKDNGNTWNDLTTSFNTAATSIAMRSNAELIFYANGNSINKLTSNSDVAGGWKYNYWMKGDIPTATGTYNLAVSFQGNIMIAADTLCSAVFTSYDGGSKSWYREARFKQSAAATGFTGAALSSDGLVEVIVGLSSTLQSIISVPVSTGTTTTVSSYNNTSIVVVNAGFPGASGYTTIPTYKSLPGPTMYVWRTPQPGPRIYPQTGTGEAVVAIDGKSGWYISNGVQIGVIVVNQYDTPYCGFVVPGGYPTTNYNPPTITKVTYGIGTELTSFFIKPADTGDLPPGTYQLTAGVSATSPIQTDIAIAIPLRPPTITSVIAVNEGHVARVVWAISPTYNVTPTFKVYSNTTVISSPGYAIRGEDVTNVGSIFAVGVQSIFGTISSSITYSSSFTPPNPPAALACTGYTSATIIRFTWDSASGVNYNVYSNGTFLGNIGSNLKDISLSPGSTVNFQLEAVSQSSGYASSKVSLTKNNNSNVLLQNTVGVTTTTIATPFWVTFLQAWGPGGFGGNGSQNINGAGGGGGGQGGNAYLPNGINYQFPPCVVYVVAAQPGSNSYVSINGFVIGKGYAGGDGNDGGNWQGGGAGAGGTYYLSGSYTYPSIQGSFIGASATGHNGQDGGEGGGRPNGANDGTGGGGRGGNGNTKGGGSGVGYGTGGGGGAGLRGDFQYGLGGQGNIGYARLVYNYLT